MLELRTRHGGWALNKGRLGVPLPRGPAAGAIGFLQRYKPRVDFSEPIPIYGAGDGIAVRITGTERKTFVSIWHGDYSVAGGILEPCRTTMQFPHAKHARCLHISQVVPAQEGVSFDGMFELLTMSGEKLSAFPAPVAIFNSKFRWVKRLWVGVDEVDYEDEYEEDY